MRGPKGNLVLIEVKRAGTDLNEHQEQLLRYAFDENVPLAALTNGLVWRLYLPRAPGNWEQRQFLRIDFREQHAGDAASALHRFLNRDGLVDGSALHQAQREFESQERDRRVRAALREAWVQVVGDPQGLLRDLLAESVQEITGYVPDPDTLTEFLTQISRSDRTEVESGSTPRLNSGTGRSGCGDIPIIDLTNDDENETRFVTTEFARRAFWRGKPLRILETIVGLIGNTRTDAGLRVRVELDKRKYPTGVTATDAEMDALSLHRNEFHGDWNYEVPPR